MLIKKYQMQKNIINLANTMIVRIIYIMKLELCINKISDLNYYICIMLFINIKQMKKKKTTTMGFEPTRDKPKGLAIPRLNHSAKLSLLIFKIILI